VVSLILSSLSFARSVCSFPLSRALIIKGKHTKSKHYCFVRKRSGFIERAKKPNSALLARFFGSLDQARWRKCKKQYGKSSVLCTRSVPRIVLVVCACVLCCVAAGMSYHLFIVRACFACVRRFLPGQKNARKIKSERFFLSSCFLLLSKSPSSISISRASPNSCRYSQLRSSLLLYSPCRHLHRKPFHPGRR